MFQSSEVLLVTEGNNTCDGQLTAKGWDISSGTPVDIIELKKDIWE